MTTGSTAHAMPGIADATQIRTGLRESLRRGRNPDGGWGYSAGKRSRLEPTCWALLALAAADRRPVETQRLTAWARHQGWLVDVTGAPPNQAFNALAALTLLQDASTVPLTQPILSNLLSAKGKRYGRSEQSPEDGSLQAWSWVEGTASWVEPTAWTLLLLKRLRSSGSLPQEGTARIDVGEQFLFDRVCAVGGWNYGNRQVYGHDLWPYVPTTALALLALQDRRDVASVKRSLEQMKKDLLTERSVLALALAFACLCIYSSHSPSFDGAGPSGRDDGAGSGYPGVKQQLASLAAQVLETPEDNLLGQAMALYALSDPSRPTQIFSF